MAAYKTIQPTNTLNPTRIFTPQSLATNVQNADIFKPGISEPIIPQKLNNMKDFFAETLKTNPQNNLDSEHTCLQNIKEVKVSKGICY